MKEVASFSDGTCAMLGTFAHTRRVVTNLFPLCALTQTLPTNAFEAGARVSTLRVAELYLLFSRKYFEVDHSQSS